MFHPHSISLAIWAALAGTVATSAIAQEQSTTALERVIVTGSNIKRIDSETATPVQVLRREELRRLGVNSVRDAIESLSSATASLSDIGGSNSFASGASSASLRNLGKQSTLILLNSRRVAPYPLADYSEIFTNLDTLPLDAVERIEILRNGGSAIYGSDAVAGVINIITRSDYNGLEARASHDQSIRNQEFKTRTASITTGFGNIGTDHYNVLANIEFFQRDSVIWRDVLGDVNPRLTAKFSGFGTPSTYAYPGNIIGVGPVAGCATVTSNLCRHDRYTRFEAIPAADRVNTLISGKMDFGSGLQGFSELLLSQTNTKYISPFPAYGPDLGTTTWGDPNTNQQRTFINRGLPSNHPLIGLPAGDEYEFRYRFVDADSTASAKSTQFRALTGLKGTWENYDWESALGVMGGKTNNLERGAFSDSGFKEVIGDYNLNVDPDFFNRAYKIGQVNSPDVLNKLFPVHGSTGKVNQVFLDGKLSGEIASFEGRPVGLAAGFDLRRESFKITPTASRVSGDIVGFGVTSADASRTNGSIFSEINFPLTKQVEIQAAGRIDKFPGFNAHFSPKVGMRLEASKELLLRGTVESGFRAPNLTESAPSTKFAFDNGIADPKRCSQAQQLAAHLLDQAAILPDTDPQKTLLEARADAVQNNECSTGVASIVKNNPTLKPEVSRSFTGGAVFEPARGVMFSLDYWNIKRRDEIGLKDTNDLLAQEDSQPQGTINRIPTDPADPRYIPDETFTDAERSKYGVTAGRLESIIGQFENTSKTKTSGFDISAATRTNIELGQLDVNVNATYLMSLYNFSPVLGGYGDNLAGRYGHPRLVASFAAAIKSGNFLNSLRLTYNSATSLNEDFSDSEYTIAGCARKKWTEAECRVGEYYRLDYNLTYTGIKNLTLGAFIRNLLGERPPIDLRSLSADGSGIIPQNVEDVMGRMLRLSVEYKFF